MYVAGGKHTHTQGVAGRGARLHLAHHSLDTRVPTQYRRDRLFENLQHMFGIHKVPQAHNSRYHNIAGVNEVCICRSRISQKGLRIARLIRYRHIQTQELQTSTHMANPPDLSRRTSRSKCTNPASPSMSMPMGSKPIS